MIYTICIYIYTRCVYIYIHISQTSSMLRYTISWQVSHDNISEGGFAQHVTDRSQLLPTSCFMHSEGFSKFSRPGLHSLASEIQFLCVCTSGAHITAYRYNNGTLCLDASLLLSSQRAAQAVWEGSRLSSIP